MGERISSDDPSIRSFRARIESSGATSRPRLCLPDEAREHVDPGVHRLVLDGTVHHADVSAVDDDPVVRGIYDSARQARTPGTGENRLPGWLDSADLDIGRSVRFDVVVQDFLYGLRAPGTKTVYEALEPPSSSLSSIAASLDE